MATKIIKLHNNNTTYVPVTIAQAVQFTYDSNKAMTVQEAIEAVAGSALSISYSVTSNKTDIDNHVGTNTIDFSYNSGNVKITGVHTAGAKTLKGEGLTYIKSSGNNIIIGTTATNNTGTVTSVGSGDGLTGGSITTSGTLKVALKDYTKNASDATTADTSGGNLEPVQLDKSGNLAVYVKDTTYPNAVTTSETWSTVNQIVVTNGSGKTAKTSSKTITTVAPKSDSTDNTIPTSKAVYTAYTAGDTATLASANNYTDTKISEAVTSIATFKGDWPGTTPTDIKKGDSWRIPSGTTTLFGQTVEEGDVIIALNDNPSTETSNNTDWSVLQNNLINAVTGTGSNGKLAIWNGTHTVSTRDIQTTSWSSGSTDIPTTAAVGSYIEGKNAIYTISSNPASNPTGVITSAVKTNHDIKFTYTDLSTSQSNTGSTTLNTTGTTLTTGVSQASNGKITSTGTTIKVDHTGTGTAGKLTYWNGATTHTAVTASYGDSSSKYVYVDGGVLKEGTIPTGANNYSLISVSAHSTNTSDSISTNSSAVNLAPTSSTDKLTIESLNKWIHVKGTNGTANGDKVSFTHALKGTGGTAKLQKFAYDEAGHIGAVADVSIDKTLQYDVYNSSIDFTLLDSVTPEATNKTIVTNIS